MNSYTHQAAFPVLWWIWPQVNLFVHSVTPVGQEVQQAQKPWHAEDAAWDYDVEAQALQMRLFDLNAIMPGALRKLDHNHVAAAAARQVSATSRVCCGLTRMAAMRKFTM